MSSIRYDVQHTLVSSNFCPRTYQEKSWPHTFVNTRMCVCVCVCLLCIAKLPSKRQDSTETEQRVAQILSEAQRAIHQQASALQKASTSVCFCQIISINQLSFCQCLLNWLLLSLLFVWRATFLIKILQVRPDTTSMKQFWQCRRLLLFVISLFVISQFEK